MPVATVEFSAMLKLDVAKMRQLREALDLNQSQVAKRAKMSVTRWSDIESGSRANVTLDTLGIIADALKCDPAVLLLKDKRRN